MSYTDKVNREWWKYEIAYTFHAICPEEVEAWDADKILTHLAAIQELRRREEQQQKQWMSVLYPKRK